MPRVPHNIHNQFTDGAEVVGLNRRPRLTRRKIPWYSFLLDADSNPGL
jgi:hypothetical protein